MGGMNQRVGAAKGPPKRCIADLMHQARSLTSGRNDDGQDIFI